MFSIRNSADLEQVLAGPLSSTLRRLLEERRAEWVADTDIDLGEVAHVIIVQRGDTLASIETAAGVPLATDTPFEYVERHDGWLEAVVILSDDGCGIVLFVADCVTTDPALLLALLAHA